MAEVKTMTNVTSAITIEHLCSIFSTHGIPEALMSNKGSASTSAEFTDVVKNNGI